MFQIETTLTANVNGERDADFSEQDMKDLMTALEHDIEMFFEYLTPTILGIPRIGRFSVSTMEAK